MSPATICCGTPPTLAMMVPAKPPTRNLRPFKSSLVLISFRNQPPICAPVLPVGIPRQLYSFRRSLSISVPPPNRSHEICCRVLRPNGSAVPNVNAGVLAPIIIQRGVAHLDRAVRHGIEHLQTWNDFAGRKRLNLEAIVC